MFWNTTKKGLGNYFGVESDDYYDATLIASGIGGYGLEKCREIINIWV